MSAPKPYPGAVFKPLGPQTQPKMRAHDVICLHTMVGNLTSTGRMFGERGYTGTESHFGVGGPWGDDHDGEVWQWQDTEFSADANLEGRDNVLSIETGDNAPHLARDIRPWTPAQCEAISRLIAYLCKRYDIPCRLIPDTKPGRRGIGYHRQGVQHSGGGHPAGWLQPGGRRWSKSTGKECPGEARIKQVPGVIERAAALLRPEPEETDPMAGITLADIKKAIADAVPTTEEVAAEVIRQLQTVPVAINKPSDSEIADAKAAGKPVPVGSPAPAAWFWQNIEADGDNAAAAILGKLDQLLDATRALAEAVGSRPAVDTTPKA